MFEINIAIMSDKVIQECAAGITVDLLVEKSRSIYEKVWKEFPDWCRMTEVTEIYIIARV